MKCSDPTCDGETKVIYTTHATISRMERRRECITCGRRFKTHESIDGDIRQTPEAAEKEREAARRRVQIILAKLEAIRRDVEEIV